MAATTNNAEMSNPDDDRAEDLSTACTDILAYLEGKVADDVYQQLTTMFVDLCAGQKDQAEGVPTGMGTAGKARDLGKDKRRANDRAKFAQDRAATNAGFAKRFPNAAAVKLAY